MTSKQDTKSRTAEPAGQVFRQFAWNIASTLAKGKKTETRTTRRPMRRAAKPAGAQ